MISAFILLVAAQAAAAAPPANMPAPTPNVPVAPPPPPLTGGEPARARTTLASYVSDDDYPDKALFNGEAGTTGFRLNIATDGSVSDCTVRSSSGSPSIDEATCAIMRGRARFTPARTADGRPTTDTVAARVIWRIAEREENPGAQPFPVHRAWAITPLASLVQPADRPQAAFDGTTRFEVGLGPDGNVTDCTIRASSGATALDEAACRIVRERGRFAPGRDENGRMVPDVLRGHIAWAAPAPRATSPSAEVEASVRTWLAGQGIELRQAEMSPDETVSATLVDRSGNVFRGICRMVPQAGPLPDRLACHQAVDAQVIANLERLVRQWLAERGTVLQVALRRLDDDRIRGEARIRDHNGREKTLTCLAVRTEFGSDSFNWDCL